MIEVRDIQKTYAGRKGLLANESVRALRGVTLTIPDRGAVALIGESGCGKTTLGRILCGLETYDSGDLVFDGVSLGTLSTRERNRRSRKVQLVHQDPYAALNPVRTVDKILGDPLRLYARQTGKDRDWIRARMHELLSLVGLDPEGTIYKYPHNLSGGQRQRVVIARALTVDPAVLVADEAVSMIDVSLRLGILKLLNDLRRRLGIAVVFITHDVAAGRYVSHDGQMYVIYRGEVFEHGATDEVIQSPVNPYTQSLLSAVPVMRGLEVPGPDRRIPQRALDGPQETRGCLFAPRCPYAEQRCHVDHPGLEPYGTNSRVSRCFFSQPRQVVAVPVSPSG